MAGTLYPEMKFGRATSWLRFDCSRKKEARAARIPHSYVGFIPLESTFTMDCTPGARARPRQYSALIRLFLSNQRATRFIPVRVHHLRRRPMRCHIRAGGRAARKNPCNRLHSQWERTSWYLHFAAYRGFVKVRNRLPTRPLNVIDRRVWNSWLGSTENRRYFLWGMVSAISGGE